MPYVHGHRLGFAAQSSSCVSLSFKQRGEKCHLLSVCVHGVGDVACGAHRLPETKVRHVVDFVSPDLKLCPELRTLQKTRTESKHAVDPTMCRNLQLVSWLPADGGVLRRCAVRTMTLGCCFPRSLRAHGASGISPDRVGSNEGLCPHRVSSARSTRAMGLALGSSLWLNARPIATDVAMACHPLGGASIMLGVCNGRFAAAISCRKSRHQSLVLYVMQSSGASG